MSEKNIKLVNINDIPKWFKAIFLLVPLAGLLLIGRSLDNDFYFLYTTGEYIVNSHTFPTADFLSMHSTMQIIVQQWLTDAIFYFVYSRLGKAGMIMLMYICYALFATVIYKLFKLVSDNFFISASAAFIVDACLAPMYFVTRPQIFTFLVVALELLALEKYVKTKKWVHLIWLPILSILQINIHSSMWIMLFVFMAPYIAGAIPLKKGKLKQEPCCSLLALIVSAVATAGVGLINPYGIKSILYIFTSFGYEEISDFIIEMKPLALDTNSGKCIIIVAALTIIIMMMKKNIAKFSTRFMLLYLGTLALAFITQKSAAYFFICGGVAFCYYLSDYSFNLKITEENKEPSKKQNTTRLALIGVMLVLVVVLLVKSGDISDYINKQYASNSNGTSTSEKASITDYEALDEIAEILPDADSIKLYTGFNYGQYMEFKGYHPYIDGRAELFLKDNNKEYDYMKELYELTDAKIYYKDFIERYDFDYLIVYQDECYLYNSLMHDKDYKILYQTEKEEQNLVLFAPVE